MAGRQDWTVTAKVKTLRPVLGFLSQKHERPCLVPPPKKLSHTPQPHPILSVPDTSKAAIGQTVQTGPVVCVEVEVWMCGLGVTVPARIQRCQSDILSTAQRVRQRKRGAGYKQG
jgi:hypothetical protein